MTDAHMVEHERTVAELGADLPDSHDYEERASEAEGRCNYSKAAELYEAAAATETEGDEIRFEYLTERSDDCRTKAVLARSM